MILFVNLQRAVAINRKPGRPEPETRFKAIKKAASANAAPPMMAPVAATATGTPEA